MVEKHIFEKLKKKKKQEKCGKSSYFVFKVCGIWSITKNTVFEISNDVQKNIV